MNEWFFLVIYQKDLKVFIVSKFDIQCDLIIQYFTDTNFILFWHNI